MKCCFCLSPDETNENDVSLIRIISVICAKIGVVGDMERTFLQLHQYLNLLVTPSLCMQRRRYSLCGVYAAALLKHAVVGWGLHYADHEGVCGVSQ